MTSSTAGRGWPNHFVAIQISNPEIHKAVHIIQDIITSKKPVYKRTMIELITLHITLCTLCLPGNDDVRRAKNALLKIENTAKETLGRNPVTLKFKGIGDYDDEVLFVKAEPGEPLTQVESVHRELLKALRDEGLTVNDGFHPHLTIMKMVKDKSLKKKRIYTIPKNLYHDKCDMDFGNQTVRSIQLLKTGVNEDAYYSCYHEIDLGIDDGPEGDHIDCCGVQSVTPTSVLELPPQ